MAILYLNDKRFRKILIAGSDMVFKNREKLNKINVFPVPDGDTGTNMSMTLMSIIREVENLNDISLETTLKAAAWGGMMGARGNSGIILAQIFNGLADVRCVNDRFYGENIVEGIQIAAKKAYKAILNPTEGTILTVISDAAKAAEKAINCSKDLAYLIDEMANEAKASVERTPYLLPKLKDAGVVDAGGLGIFYFFEGMKNLVAGIKDSDEEIVDEMSPVEIDNSSHIQGLTNRFCTEFIIKGSLISEDKIKSELALLGDSIVVVGDTRLARVHVHTNDPEKVLKYASDFGKVSSIKVDDMLHQHTSRTVSLSASKNTSIVSIVLGDGLREIFYNAGAEMVIDGGPSKNPSTAEIISAIEAVSSHNVIVLPNNKNIYPAALQAADTSHKNVTVIKTTTVPEGISAILAYVDHASFEENCKNMENAFSKIKSGIITQASKDTVSGAVKIAKGDYIGVFRGNIYCSCKTPGDALEKLLMNMADDTDEIITLFYGDMVEKDDAENIQAFIQSKYASKTVELYFGGQPYAHYIISVE